MAYRTGIRRGGSKKDPLYSVYFNMLKRCYNKNYYYFHRYGGRGIVVCDRWNGENGFANFKSDMGGRQKDYQLDRINTDGNYSPDNCRWVDKYTQMANISTNNPVVGVGWHSQRNKYRARIKIGGSEKSLGLYRTHNEAVVARQEAEIRYGI